MRRSVFHKGCFVNGLKRSIALSVLVLALQLLTQLFIIYLRGITGNIQSTAYFSEESWPLCLIYYIFTPVLLYSFFRFQMTRSGSDPLAALPVKKSSYAFSYALATLVVSACVLLLSAAFIMCFNAGVYPHIGSENIAAVIFTYLSAITYMCGAMMLSLSLCGRRGTTLLTLLIIMFVPRLMLFGVGGFVINCINKVRIATAHASGVELLKYNGSFLDPRLNSVTNVLYITETRRILIEFGEPLNLRIASIIHTTFLGLAYLCLGIFLYGRRPSETAGNAAVSRRVSFIIGILPSLTVSLIPLLDILNFFDLIPNYIAWKKYSGGVIHNTSFIPDPGAVVYDVAMYLLAFLLYILYECINEHRFPRPVRLLRGLAAILIFDLVYAIICLSLGYFGVANF